MSVKLMLPLACALLTACTSDAPDDPAAPVEEPDPCFAAYDDEYDVEQLVGSWATPPCEGESDASCRFESVEVDGEARCYVVSVPPDDAKRHLLLVWHGSGQNGAVMRLNMSSEFVDLDLEAAVGGDALLVYPDGKVHQDCMGDSCWNREPEGPDVRFFDALVAKLARDWNIDPAQVFSFGHSRGGRFVEVLGCYRSDAHLALASASAGPGNVSACPGSAPMWISQSELDQTIPLGAGAGHVNNWVERNGCDPVADPLTFPRDVCTALPGCDEPVSWCPTTEDEWEGHAPPELADEELWAFFAAQL